MYDMDAGVSYLFVDTVTPLLPVKRHGATLFVQLQRPLHEFGNSGRGFEVEFANRGASTGRWSRIRHGAIGGNILQSIGVSKSRLEDINSPSTGPSSYSSSSSPSSPSK